MAAMALAASLGLGRSVQATPTLQIEMLDASGNASFGGPTTVSFGSGATITTMEATTIYVGENSSGSMIYSLNNPSSSFYDPATKSSSSGNYFYTINLTNVAESSSQTQAQLLDATTAVSFNEALKHGGSQPNPAPSLIVQLTSDSFSQPTTPLQMQTSLTITGITTTGGTPSPDYPNGSGDPDNVQATGQFNTNANVSTATGSELNANPVTRSLFGLTDPIAGNVVSLSNASAPFTLTSTMQFNLGGENDQAVAENTVTVTGTSADPPSPTPEPSTIALAITGLGAMGLMHLRRRRAAKAAA
jgi:hypothetical protein